MPKVYFTSILFFCSSILYAQRASVKWSDEMSIKRSQYINGVLYSDENNIHVLRSSFNFGNAIGSPFLSTKAKIHLTFEHYNKDFTLVNAKEIEHEDRNFEGVTTVGEKIYLFSSFFDKPTKQNQFFTTVYDLNYNIVRNEKQVLSIDAEKRRNAGTFSRDFSPDGSKLLVYADLPFEKEASERFNIRVLDLNLTKIWEREIELPYREAECDVIDKKVTNEGNVLVMIKIFDSPKRREKIKAEDGNKIPGYRYAILKYSLSGEAPKEYNISLANKFITDIVFEISPNKDFVCAGFYSDEKRGRVNGTFYLVVDPATNSNRSAKSNPFSSELLEKFGEYRTKKQKRKGEDLEDLDDKFSFRDFTINEDGSANLIAEYYFMHVVTTTHRNSNGSTYTTTTYYYYYLDGLMMHFEPSGIARWTVRIPKYQLSVNDGGYFSSFAIMHTQGKTLLLFNDNPNNTNVDEDKKAEALKLKNSVGALVSIDNNTGETTKQELWKNGEEESGVSVFCVPKYCKQASPNSMVLVGERFKGLSKKMVSLGRLDIK